MPFVGGGCDCGGWPFATLAVCGGTGALGVGGSPFSTRPCSRTGAGPVVGGLAPVMPLWGGGADEGGSPFAAVVVSGGTGTFEAGGGPCETPAVSGGGDDVGGVEVGGVFSETPAVNGGAGRDEVGDAV
jgi:hypothetical protein